MQILHVLYHRMETAEQIRQQKIFLLFCNSYRGDEALAVSNAKSKVWTNFCRIIIILLIYKSTICKFYQIIWLWLLRFYYSRKQKYSRFIFAKSFAVSLQKIKITHSYANLKYTFKVLVTLQRF